MVAVAGPVSICPEHVEDRSMDDWLSLLMDGWCLLLFASSVLAFSCGIQLFIAPVWRKFDFRGTRGRVMAPMAKMAQPEHFKRRLAIDFVLFVFSTWLFLVALFAILNPPES